MQSNIRHIFKLTAERTKKSEALYKDIGNCVFSALYAYMKRPSTLIVKLKGIGTWYLRKNRMEIIVNEFPLDMDKNPQTPTDIFKYENKKEMYKTFENRLKDYQEYINIRQDVRKKRNETQTLLTSKEDSE